MLDLMLQHIAVEPVSSTSHRVQAFIKEQDIWLHCQPSGISVSSRDCQLSPMRPIIERMLALVSERLTPSHREPYLRICSQMVVGGGMRCSIVPNS